MAQNQKMWKRIAWTMMAACEAAVALLIAKWQGMAAANVFSLNARYLSDGCFVVGMVATGIGLLTWISTTGFFDMLSYGVQYGVRALIGLFGGSRSPNDQTFYDYKMAREAKRSKAQYAILLSGVAFIALSVVFLMLYYRV